MLLKPRLALLISAALFSLACTKAGDTPAAKDVPEPADLIAVAQVASPKAALATFASYANGISPGAGAGLSIDMVGQALGALVGAPALQGFDLDKPLAIMVLDPKTHASPFVIVGTVADAAKLKAATSVKVNIEGSIAVVGAAEAVDASSAYGLGVVAARHAPRAVTVTFSPAKLVTRYKGDIENAKKSMASAMQGSPGAAQIVNAELDLFVKLGDQTESGQLVVDATNDEASFEIALTPKAGSTFAEFNKAQKPGADDHLLGLLPSSDSPSMVMVGHYELGPARPMMIDLMGSFLEPFLGAMDAAQRKKWEDTFALFDGDVAMNMSSNADGGLTMQEIFGVSDGAKAAAALKDVLSPLTGGKTADLMGMKLTWEAKGDTATHDGVAIGEYAFKPDYANMNPMQADMLRKMYGDSLPIFIAGFDKSMVFVMGAGGGDVIGKLIDSVRKGTRYEASPAVKDAIASAKAGKTSILMVMNLAQTMAQVTGHKVDAKSGLAIDIGFADGVARMRIGMPAAHFKELMGAMMR